MSKHKEHGRAIILREGGASIANIASKLKVSKSTVSYWCRDIALSQKAKDRIVRASERKSTAGILWYTEKIRQKRIEETVADMELGAVMVGTMSDRDVLLAGLGLYWGEGYKRGSQEFGFTNSDLIMIQFYLRWLKICFGVEKKDLILRVSINEAHKSRVAEVESYWSANLGIPLVQFTRISLIKSASKRVYPNLSDHYGTLRVKVRRGTRLRRTVLGAIKHLSQIKAE